MAAARIALSLSGGGHLLPYHLAVGRTLMDASKQGHLPYIHEISGSSAGAIAAAVIALAPDTISDYADQFIQERGNALKLLEQCLSTSTTTAVAKAPSLYICTTKCKDGSVHLFHVDKQDTTKLLKCVRASCTIPRTSFHPTDVLASSGNLVYPDTDGILIDGDYHVDGGIAAPAPPVPDSKDVIVVSPISGSSPYPRISPRDSSFSIWWELKCRGDFHVRPSIQNLQALRVASGSTTSEELRSWYEQGMDDANSFLKEWNTS